MLYKITTSLLVFFSCLMIAKSQQTAEKVVRQFYGTYDVTSLEYPKVEFEKRMSNWYITTIRFDKKKVIKSNPILFYDGQKREYVELKIKKRAAPVTVNPLEYMNEQEIAEFNLQPYSGYPGCFHDVIKEYRNKRNLTDKELYALGRSYSRRANAPIVNQAGDAIEAESYNLPFGTEVFSPAQLKSFEASQDSAIETFRQLYARNPKFETIVGSIGIKYANEILVKFHTLNTFSETRSQTMVIPRAIYPDSILKAARAYLSSCPRHSVFLSFGDNDFYPLLYLQNVEGYRKDVYVINYNLLGVDKFIYRATQPQFGEQGIILKADTSVYRGQFNDYFYRKEGSSDIHTIDQLIDKLREYATADSMPYTLTATNISMDIREVSANQGESLHKIANLYLEDVRYMLKSQWILLDIINNLGKRKIAFAYGFNDELTVLNKFLEQQGSVYVYKSPDETR